MSATGLQLTYSEMHAVPLYVVVEAVERRLETLLVPRWLGPYPITAQTGLIPQY